MSNRTAHRTSRGTEVFPAVNLVRSLPRNSSLRAGYSATVNRPEFRELAAFEFTDVVGSRAVRGNPDLERALIHNVDGRWEMFLGPSSSRFTRRGDDADNGIEADNNEFNNDLLPRANPQIYNITMCADPDTNEGRVSVRGILFRRGTAVTFRSFLVTGFRTTGMQFDGSSTLNQINNGTTQVGAGVIWGMPTTTHPATAPFVASGRFPSVVRGQDGGLSPNCSRHQNPDLRPTSIATLAGGQISPIQPPNDGLFETVTFIGAVGPNPGDDWTQGWTRYPQN